MHSGIQLGVHTNVDITAYSICVGDDCQEHHGLLESYCHVLKGSIMVHANGEQVVVVAGQGIPMEPYQEYFIYAIAEQECRYIILQHKQ